MDKKLIINIKSKNKFKYYLRKVKKIRNKYYSNPSIRNQMIKYNKKVLMILQMRNKKMEVLMNLKI